MNDVSFYLDSIDQSRIRRAKELSELKVRMKSIAGVTNYGIHTKSIVVLTYAHWEGFYNECVKLFFKFLRENKYKVVDYSWHLLIGSLRSDLKSLRDRGFSAKSEYEFVDKLKLIDQHDFEKFDLSIVLSRSNLNYSNLESNFNLLGFSLEGFQEKRLKIDHELVGWRHSVAHGNEPDLGGVDIDDHILFTQDLLHEMASKFQMKMVSIPR